jgi:nitroreductase
MTLSAAEVARLKIAPPVDGVLPEALARWSPRSYSDRPVADADLAKLFEAVRWTASANNEQPWLFFLGRKGDPTFQKIFDVLMPGNQEWAGRAPVLILGFARTLSSHNSSPLRTALYDLGQAAAVLCLAAAHQGLNTRQMAGFDVEAAKKAFQLPEQYVAGAAIALGYQGEPEQLAAVERLITQEQAPRVRKAVSEFVLADWNTPAQL